MIPQLLSRPAPSDAERWEANQEYWLSYSDLMAGLLMVFTLMLLAALYSYQSGVEGVREVLAIRQEVVETLEGAFEGEERIVEVQPDGTVRFADQVLFSEGSAALTATGQEQLEIFARQYVQTLFGEPSTESFRDQLEAIVVEGHTNDNGSYAYNLALSQARAFAVMQVLLSTAVEHRADLERYVTANGRSFSKLVCQDGTVDTEFSTDPERRCLVAGGVDKEASRRIEIRFALKDGEILAELLQLLDDQ